LIALLCLIAQISSAQYQKVTRGQTVKFDTAVAIRIDVYRLESQKMKIGRVLIDSLASAQRSLAREIELTDSLNALYIAENRALQKTLISKDSVNRLVYQNSLETQKIAIKCLENKPVKWGQDPKTWGLIGVVVASILFNLSR
jgi:hypothetical protein